MDPPPGGLQPAPSRVATWLPLALLVSGLLVTAGVHVVVTRLEADVVQGRFELEAKQRSLALAKQFGRAEALLHSIDSLFESSEFVTREEFRDFVTPLLTRHPEVHALAYHRTVLAADRRDFVSDLRREHQGYQIVESVSGSLVSAATREVYFPNVYVEPFRGNEVALGFDLGSEPTRRRAIELAQQRAGFTLTGPIELLGDGAREPDFLGLYPHLSHPAEPGGRSALLGIVVGAYHVSRVVEQSQSSFTPDVVDLRLLDVTDEEQLLYAPKAAASDLLLVDTIEAGGRRYRLELRPTVAFLASQETRAPQATLAIGAAFSLCLAGFVGLLTRRSARIAWLGRVAQHELSQRQRAEASLRESEERLSLTLDAVSDGAWDWDIVADTLHLSPAWLSALGYARGHLPSGVAAWTELLHPDDRDDALARRRAHLDGEAPIFECEARLRTERGLYRTYLSRGQVVARDAAGAPLRMVGTDTDVTQRKAEEAQRAAMLAKLQHSQKLESLGVVVGGIAHDFNNLLTGILSGAELLDMQLGPEHPSSRVVGLIDRSGQRAAELIRQMLAYAGRGRFVLEDVDLSALATEMPELVSASIAKSAELRTELADEVWVRADPSQVQQVMLNLLINASDALGGPGTIWLRTGRVDVDADQLLHLDVGADAAPGTYGYIEVVDDGAGMSPDVREKVFDPFFTTKADGRGLGLAAVLGVVRWHHGLIDLRSAPGEGTTLRIYLPALDRSASPPAPKARPAPASLSGTVLLVDDEAAVRQTTGALLSRLGLQHLDAVDGEAGLALFTAEHERIDMALLDMSMPKLGGVELARAIRELRPDLPITIMSGNAVIDDLAGLPDVELLPKPFRLTDLQRHLEAQLGTPQDVAAEPDPDPAQA